MRDKNGCLNCKNLARYIRGGRKTDGRDVESEHRTREAFGNLMASMNFGLEALECREGLWSTTRNVYTVNDIINIVFGKDRGRECTEFAAYDPNATPEAAAKRDRRLEEIRDRKATRRLAIIAIILSCVIPILIEIVRRIFS